jgi:hypothetical protein
MAAKDHAGHPARPTGTVLRHPAKEDDMKLRRSAILCLSVLALVPALLLAQEKPATETAEAPAWITHVEGRVFFQNFEKAAADMAIKPGDELNTQAGRVEIELGEGNWIRLDNHTRVVFSDIQKGSATLSLWEGSLYLHLNNQAVKVRSPQEEHVFQDKGLVRIDIAQNATKIFKDPAATDDFDVWNQGRDQALASSDAEAGPDRSPGFSTGGFSAFWPWSPLDWYGGFYPYWSYWRPYMGFGFWPSWYFGFNPFWFGDPWFYGYGYFGGGFYARGYGRGGHRFDGGVRRSIRRPEGFASGYPSRIASRAIRTSPYRSGSRTLSGTARSGSGRTVAGGSSTRSGGRTYSGSSGGRSSGASRGGGSSRGGGASRGGGGGRHR